MCKKEGKEIVGSAWYHPNHRTDKQKRKTGGVAGVQTGKNGKEDTDSDNETACNDEKSKN